MTKKCRVATLFIIAMLVPGPRALTQDSLSVVILSPRIGAVIDANEREYFHVFSQFEPLDSAVVLKSIGGRYYVHIMKTAKEGLPADITFAYTEVVLARMAEKIDHLEALEHGTYHMGDHPPALQTAGIQLISERARALSPPTSAAAMFASVDSTKRSTAWGVSSDNQVRSGRTITIVTASDNTMTGVLLSVRPGEILLSERGGVEETALAGHP